MTDLTCRHVMVDLETTGTNAGRNAIIQIAAFRFNPGGAIDPEPFNACLRVPPWRSWDEGTRKWWLQTEEKKTVIQRIMARQEDPREVMERFFKWVCATEGGAVLWGKPSHFEFPFLESYFTDFGMTNPFHYRYAMDMNSFIRGLYYPEPVDDSVVVPFDGEAHDAVYDALNQVQTVMAHVENVK